MTNIKTTTPKSLCPSQGEVPLVKGHFTFVTRTREAFMDYAREAKNSWSHKKGRKESHSR